MTIEDPAEPAPLSRFVPKNILIADVNAEEQRLKDTIQELVNKRDHLAASNKSSIEKIKKLVDSIMKKHSYINCAISLRQLACSESHALRKALGRETHSEDLYKQSDLYIKNYLNRTIKLTNEISCYVSRIASEHAHKNYQLSLEELLDSTILSSSKYNLDQSIHNFELMKRDLDEMQAVLTYEQNRCDATFQELETQVVCEEKEEAELRQFAEELGGWNKKTTKR